MNQIKLMCYTRTPLHTDIYSEKLAYSMHLAFSENGESFQPLNHNSGVLFAKATTNADGTLTAKTLRNPQIHSAEDAAPYVAEHCASGSTGRSSANSGRHAATGNSGNLYFITAEQCEADGTPDASCSGKVLLFTTSDFIHYEENGLVAMKEIIGKKYNQADRNDTSRATADDTKSPDSSDMPPCTIEGAVPCSTVTISAEQLAYLKAKLLSKKNTNVPATTYHFPIVENRADPCIGRWNGKYYFIATNDADQNHTLYLRESNSIDGIVEAYANKSSREPETLLLDSTTYEGIGNLLWAPEFHIIKNKLYIFHACTPGEFFKEESHVMELKAGGNPMNRSDWSKPHRVVKKDGTFLAEAGKTITLDMTEFEWNNKCYVVWSQRQFLPVDQGAFLYIAEINPDTPWVLASDPVLLTKPEYSWENNHTFVDEGPFSLIHNGTLFLTFSAAAIDATYVVGLLTLRSEKDNSQNQTDCQHDAHNSSAAIDPLDPNNWVKQQYPLLTSRCTPGEYGTGHNSYVTDDNGVVWNAYHARPGVNGPRSTGIKQVCFDVDGVPVLDAE